MSSSQTDPDQLLPTVESAPARIVRAKGRRRQEAIERLVSGASAAASGGPARLHAERFVEFSAANGICIDALWTALDERDRVTAVVLAVPNPGRTAIVFASCPANAEGVSEHARVIEHACHELAGCEIDLVQTLLEPHDRRQQHAFLAGGFTELARLIYEERPLPGPRRRPACRWPPGVTVETYREAMRDELLAVLDASYEDTLDCPGLRGLRRTEDILAGHQGTGSFDPALWTVLRLDGEARGALLLNRSPASNTIELVYIGLAPAARGRGLGRQLLRHGLDLVAGRRERAVTLAVDDQNAPALRLYAREGFRRVLRRVALIRPLVPAKRDAST